MEPRLAGLTTILQNLEETVANLPTVVKALCSDLNELKQISSEDKQLFVEAIATTSAEALKASNHTFVLIF